jgi:hypothetical protein
LVDTTLALAQQWESIEKTIVVTPEMAGVYNLIFYWRNDASVGKYASKRSAVVDNILITKESCSQPIDLTVLAYDDSSADLAWAPISDNSKEYELVVTNEANLDLNALTADNIAFRTIVDTTAITVKDLAENTTYYFNLRSICGVNDTSLWSETQSFKTSCTPQRTDTIYNMDSEEGYYLPAYTSTGTNSKYKVPNCFVNSHESMEFTSSNATYFPYLEKNTATARYSRSGDYALRFYRTNKTTQPGGIIALPMIDGDLDELQVKFWMRCVHNTISTGKLTVTGLGSTYNRKVTVGTMTDPYDASTFEPLGVFEYPYKNGDLTSSNLISQDETGNNYWVECAMPLTGAKGKYIAFKNEGYEDATTYNLVYIDDITVTSLSCTTPVSLQVEEITSSSMVIDAMVSEAEKYVVQIADNEDFEKARIDTVASLPAKIENLSDGTLYYVKVQSLCSAEETSKWSLPTSFRTLTKIVYNQVFSNESYRPDDWSQASSPKLDDYMSGTTTTFSMMLPTGSGGWTSEVAMFDEGMFSTRHISVDVLSTNKYWLFTPIFEMPESGKLHLVFDLALTSQNSNLPPTDDDKGSVDDRFAVIVSEDGGKTWNESNMTVWGHGHADAYRFFDIPHTGKQYAVDLSKYAGKDVQIAFYVESTVSLAAKMELHLDNVHLNAYKEEIVNMAICQTEDFDYAPFFIQSGDLNIGDNSYNYLNVSNKEADTNYKLNLVVTPMSEKVIEASICEGDVYSQNNFSGLTEPGVYKQKLPSASGCDSVVTLNLSVTSAVRTMTVDTICYGSSVEWNGVEYNRTGVYIDTLVSAVTGCDSIVTFVLNVKEAISAEAYVNICFGDTYTFGTQTISASGDYTETFETAKGCDSIVTLHATVLPDYRKTINATIVKGNRYNDNGFVGLSEAGTYTLPLKSKVGDCDSTITLNLRVVDDSTQVAVGNVSAMDLVLVPNPVKSGNTLYVNAEFTKEQTNGLVVEVFNAVGQRVYIDEPYIYPIEITGLIQRGVYLVRITTGDGKLYQSKVVVE